MRVIAGSKRRTLLKTIAGDNTRPTTDRIKETLFNILQDDLYACHFLDLFAGSGQMGIEALSRGAGEAVFVENNKEALACIRDNLQKTAFTNQATVMGQDVLSALSTLSVSAPFDIVFMDPPYKLEIEEAVLIALAKKNLVRENSLIIIEADLKRDFSFVCQCGFYIDRIKTYKTNQHVFLRLQENTTE